MPYSTPRRRRESSRHRLLLYCIAFGHKTNASFAVVFPLFVVVCWKLLFTMGFLLRIEKWTGRVGGMGWAV
ncbi:hypothetical protein KY285_008016 [Solanum tuberosum]|nr:hypothetical protein KY285_008016 [Solanum tuberosum]